MNKFTKTIFWCFVFIILPIFLPIIIFYALAYYSERNNPIESDFTKSIYKNTERKTLSQPVELKIVTFNIQDTWVVGRNRINRMHAIARTLGLLDPDIVGFQESFIEKDRDILVRELRKHTRLQFFEYFPSGLVGSGKFIASAYPITEKFFYRYKVTGDWYKFWEGDWWAGKGCALARIEIPNVGVIDFYNTHIQAGYGNPNYRYVKEAQLKELATFVNASFWNEHPVFIVGDFNTRVEDTSHVAMVMLADLNRVMTIYSNIDHIYAKNSPHYDFEVTGTVEIIEGVDPQGNTIKLSDHHGFMSTVKITPKTQKRSNV